MCDRGDTLAMTIGGAVRGIDRCIAPLVMALNDGGFPTVASCCGHGVRPATIALADGREILVLRDYQEARRIGKLWPPLSYPSVMPLDEEWAEG